MIIVRVGRMGAKSQHDKQYQEGEGLEGTMNADHLLKKGCEGKIRNRRVHWLPITSEGSSNNQEDKRDLIIEAD